METEKHVPVSGTAASLLRRAAKSRSDRTPHTTPPDLEPFPDLPDDLIPQRADGSGRINARDIRRIEQMGTAQLVAPSSREAAVDAQRLLKQKLKDTTHAFARGELNQDQYEAIFTRYARQKTLIERILAGGTEQIIEGAAPISQGQTETLRQKMVSLPEGMVIVDDRSGIILKELGQFNIPRNLLGPMLTILNEEEDTGVRRSTQVEGGRWLILFTGNYTSSLVLFTREPSAQQLKVFEGLHIEFEQENHKALQELHLDSSQMFFPQDAQF